MKKFWVFLCTASIVLSQGVAALSTSASNAVLKQQELQSSTEQRNQRMAAKRTRFQTARQKLLDKNVTFEPELLLEADWQQKLAPILEQMPEMNTSSYETEPLNGVYLADSLFLPEQVKLAGETIILANNVVFEGSDALIRGNHSIYLYPVQSIGVMGTTLKEFRDSIGPLSLNGVSPLLDPETSLPIQPMITRGGHVTIDTSALGRKDRLESLTNTTEKGGFSIQSSQDTSGGPGADGQDGTSEGSTGSNGTQGAAGVNATCTPGTYATEGNVGNFGGNGGTGNRGGDAEGGGDAGDIYLYLDGNQWGDYSFIANGGNGGKGGAGKKGGKGGNGGQGGTGGSGVDCCSDSVARLGADGGRGGNSGAGGTGGAGGNGGNGGNGGTINITYPMGQVTISSHSATGGLPGDGGNGGAGGDPGTFPGIGGTGGDGAPGNSCLSGVGGLQGDPGAQGATGAAGATGNAGWSGNSGSYYAEGYPGCAPSPIVISTQSNKINMTDAQHGVEFDLVPNGVKERVAWTEPDSDDALLALDRNGNGTIDDGYELFGDATPQAPSLHPNGFIALAVFDKPEKGGNNDGRIDRLDAIFSSLRLWLDVNHNGVSEASELYALPVFGVEGLSLGYEETDKQDEYGNLFLYRAKVYSANDSRVTRWAYDIYLLTY